MDTRHETRSSEASDSRTRISSSLCMYIYSPCLCLPLSRRVSPSKIRDYLAQSRQCSVTAGLEAAFPCQSGRQQLGLAGREHGRQKLLVRESLSQMQRVVVVVEVEEVEVTMQP
ncbi:hypothetical protein E2C01_074390 [Portunus trituberculatus]|uniref:Uncharacterized protein n=1 Tax=Portunus trituberculatus TaxID=210409 RepID=A0A5B7I5J9_PORTR|nr:hypothetical protein [Portunus trituberculatus]